MCDTLGWALDVGGGGEGCVFACLPFCHALFSGGFHWFSGTCAPWLRGVCRVADGSVVWICLRDIVGLCLVVLCCRLCHGVFGHGIWGIRS